MAMHDAWIRSNRSTTAGFTLLEVLIAIAVVAILATVAYPSFMDSLRKSRRSDAVAALSQVQHAQERFRANRANYSDDLTGAAPTGLKLPATSPDGHYAIAVTNATTVGYVATATAKGTSPQIDDTRCRVLTITLNDVNGLIQRSSTNSAGAVNTSSNNPCWVK